MNGGKNISENNKKMLPTNDRAEVVDVDDGVAGAWGQQTVELRCSAVVVVPSQRVDDLVVLLDAAQQQQTGSLIHINAPAGETKRSDVQKVCRYESPDSSQFHIDLLRRYNVCWYVCHVTI